MATLAGIFGRVVLLVVTIGVASAQDPTFTHSQTPGLFNLVPDALLVQDIDGSYGPDLLFCNASGAYLLASNSAGNWDNEYMIVSSTASCSSMAAGTLGYAISEYLGCVVDNQTRDMPWEAATTGATVANCRSSCGYNSTYAGLQYGKECWCGNTFGNYGGAPESECNLTCLASPTQMCGSDWRNSVWRVAAGSSTAMDVMTAYSAGDVNAWEGPCISGCFSAPVKTITTASASPYLIRGKLSGPATTDYGVLVLDDVPCVAPPKGHRLRCDSVLTGTGISERIVSAVVADFNADGADDLVLGGFTGGVYFLKNNGGSWIFAQTLTSHPEAVWNMALVEISQTGKQLDLIVSGTQYTRLYLFDATSGLFVTSAPVNLPALANKGNAVPAQIGLLSSSFDGETAKNDLVWYNSSEAKLYFSFGLSQSVSSSFQAVYAVDIPFAVSAGLYPLSDFNSDGRPDLVLASATNGIQIFLQGPNVPVPTTTTPMPTTTTPSPTTTVVVTTTAPPQTTTEAPFTTAAPTTVLDTTPAPTTTAPPATTTAAPTQPPPTSFTDFVPPSFNLLNSPQGTLIDLGGEFSVTYVSFVEKTRRGVTVSELLSPSPDLTQTDELVPFDSDEIRSVFSGLLPNGASIRYTIWKVLLAKNITFAGALVQLRNNSLKQGLELSGWPFRDSSNHLEINIKFGASSPVLRSSFVSLSNEDHVEMLSLATAKYVLRARFLAVALCDSISRSLAFSFDNSRMLVTMSVPHFAQNLSVDPNFGVLLADPNNDQIPQAKKKSHKNVGIAIGVSMGVVGLLLVVSIVLLLIFWRHPTVRGFITGNRVRVATIGSTTHNQSSLSPRAEQTELLQTPSATPSSTLSSPRASP